MHTTIIITFKIKSLITPKLKMNNNNYAYRSQLIRIKALINIVELARHWDACIFWPKLLPLNQSCVWIHQFACISHIHSRFCWKNIADNVNFWHWLRSSNLFTHRQSTCFVSCQHPHLHPRPPQGGDGLRHTFLKAILNGGHPQQLHKQHCFITESNMH